MLARVIHFSFTFHRSNDPKIKLFKNYPPYGIDQNYFNKIICSIAKLFFHCTWYCIQPYHTESTSSCLITEVKQC